MITLGVLAALTTGSGRSCPHFDDGRRAELAGAADKRSDSDPTPYVAGRVVDTLNERGLAVHNAEILVLGVARQPISGEIHGSPAVAVLATLLRGGTQVYRHDPFVDRVVERGLGLGPVTLDSAALSGSNCVAEFTPHSCFDSDQVTTTQVSSWMVAPPASGAAVNRFPECRRLHDGTETMP